MFLPKPEVILTHESDLDGFVSGHLLQRLAQKLFDEEIPLEAYSFTSWRQRDLMEESAWICDFTFESRLDKPNYVVIDHHRKEGSPRNAQLIHNIEKSAGLLCYELCKEQGLGSPELDRLVHLNNVSDLFVESDPEFVLASDYANLVKHYQFWNIHEIIDGKLERLVNHPLLAVMETKRLIEDPMGLEWSKKNVRPLSANVGYVQTVLGNTNLIVHQMLDQKVTPFPVLVTLFRKNNGQVIASFRSKNGEALKVAERLQGGGHANASGATLPRSIKNVPDAIEYLKQVLNPSSHAPVRPLQNLGSVFDNLQL